MIKIFKYLDALDCFVVDPNYKVIADTLGLTEWNEVVWIGRFFSFDNDYGEHWFDNWEQRDSIEAKAVQLGIDYDDLLVLDPYRFKNGVDGPCHSDEQIVLFWRDVLKSLSLSYETIIAEARNFNKVREQDDEDYIYDLEEKIGLLKERLTD